MARRGPHCPSGLTAALSLIAAAALLVGPARAEESKVDRVELDSARSHATFGVKIMWLLPIHGRFGAPGNPTARTGVLGTVERGGHAWTTTN